MYGGLSLERLSWIYWVVTKKEVRYFSHRGNTLGDTRDTILEKFSPYLPSSKSFWQWCKSGWGRKNLQGDETFVTNSVVFAYLSIVVSPVMVKRILLNGAFLPSWSWEYIIRRAEEQPRSCPRYISVSAIRKAQLFHLFRWSSKTRAFFREKWEDVGKSICVHT